MRKKKIETVPVSIVTLALGKLQMDRLCPDVGMGMFPSMALDEVLEEYGLMREEVDYPYLERRIRDAWSLRD